MEKLLFGTFNQNKLTEIRTILGENYEIVCCADFSGLSPVEETGKTFFENAALKAKTYAQFTGVPCFADDSGLSVEALNGEPGVNSAYFAGPNATYSENNSLLLEKMKNVPNRRAYFTTVIAYTIPEGTIRYFEGRTEGTLLTAPRGQNGFGYDPLFVPDGFSQTYAELSKTEKNEISHRGKAMRLFINFLNGL